ncbi:MAG: hypothetical protein Q7V10_05300 [Methanobacteriaceae archaeon]|nr:hypothetical protein [Methanobacteriaceae archaeon]MDO9627703.1 hypothetical protein [Methanobacteriaceae archaeon]
MINIKPFLTVILTFFIVCSSSGIAFADSSGVLTVQFNKQSVNVGDQVQITVNAYNTGTVGWNNVIVSLPVPDGLKYLSHYTSVSKADYSSSSGSWVVGNMRHDSNGKTKTIYISFEVLPSAEGKTVRANGHFNSITLETTQAQFASHVSSASPDTLKVKINKNETGNGTGNGTGSGNGAGNGTGNGTASFYEEIFGNIVKSDNTTGIGNNLEYKANILQSSGGGEGQEGKNAYEVTKENTEPQQTPSNLLQALIAGLIICGLIVFGYFKGIRGN